MTDNGIPTGPIDREPLDYPAPGGYPSGDRKAEILRETFRAAGVELGAYDERIAAWLADTADWSTFATITSWVQRAAQQEGARVLADGATEYRVLVPEGGGTDLLVRRQALIHGMGWAVSVPGSGGGRAWTTEGWQESISALSVDRLFCWPDAATAVDEARRALADA